MIAGNTVIRGLKPRHARSGGESLGTKAYEQIRDDILQGHLPIGTILSRRRLADRLNMSFLPITEALQRLEAEGLVESRPRIGTRVRIPSEEDISDSYVLREALESQAARLCCEQMTPQQRDQLMRSAKHLDSLYEVSAEEKEDSQFLFSIHTYHVQFHMQIAQLACSAGLIKAIEREHVLIYNWLFDTTAQRISLPIGFHSILAKAICSGDMNQADDAMRKHVRYGRKSVIDSLRTLQIPNGWRTRRTDE